jgi:hypothetical protein
VEHRVTVLRVRESWVRATCGIVHLRPARVAGAAPDLTGLHSSSGSTGGAGLDVAGELSLMEAEVEIAVGQLALDAAQDRPAFETAVAHQIEAYRRLAERVPPCGPGTDPARERLHSGTPATRRLQRWRQAPDESEAMRTGVLAALDELEDDAERMRLSLWDDQPED